ncbi:MAG: hypothetical protein Q9162_000590 [Coniocarpon cinnabarinum]
MSTHIASQNARTGDASPTLGSTSNPLPPTPPDKDLEKQTDDVSSPSSSSGKESPDLDGDNNSKSYEVQWQPDLDHDPTSPRSISKPRKWLVTFAVASSSFCVTCNSSIYTTIYDQIDPRFHISREVSTLGLTTFVGGLMVGPMLLAPLSEFYGRRPIYICAYVMVFVWIIPCAVAQNIGTILVTRWFDGFFASAFLSVAGGTIGDMFHKHELSFPMMVYSGSPFMGPALGPLIGGFINQYTSWRWTFWVLLIWTGVQLALIVLFIPETYHPVLLRNKARRLRKETGEEQWAAPIEKLDRSIPNVIMWSCIRPFQLLTLEPMVLNLCLLSAVLLGILYLFFGAFPVVFQDHHGFTLSQVGLSFLGLFVGMLLAIFSDFFFQRYYRKLMREREAAGGERGGTDPEMRLPPTVVGVWFVVVGLFGFGWTSYPHVHWITPIVMSGFFGFGIIACYAGIFTFLVESYPLYAASALGANSFARSVFAAGFPLFGVQMYHKLGSQWATSVLAFIALALAPFPYIFFKYGKRIRKRSRCAKS